MSLQSFDGKKYVSVATYRKNGEKVPTPTWFVLGQNHLYVWTEAESGKVRRLRRNPKLAIAPCKMSGSLIGPYLDAVATIAPDDSRADLQMAFKKKYGLTLALSRLFSRSRAAKRVFLDISP